MRILREHSEAQILERTFAGDAYVDRDLVFADALGRFCRYPPSHHTG